MIDKETQTGVMELRATDRGLQWRLSCPELTYCGLVCASRRIDSPGGIQNSLITVLFTSIGGITVNGRCHIGYAWYCAIGQFQSAFVIARHCRQKNMTGIEWTGEQTRIA